MTNETEAPEYERKGSLATYNLMDALKRNPLLIQAGADICAEAVSTIDAQAARIAELDRAVLIETNHVDRLRKERDREKARAEAAEAKLAKADALAAECERAFDDVDGTGTQEFYLALYTYTDSRATLADLQKPIATRDDPA